MPKVSDGGSSCGRLLTLARRRLFKLMFNPYADGFMMAVILSNIGAMACDYWGIEQRPDYFRAYTLANDVFSCFYYVEAGLKIAAAGNGRGGRLSESTGRLRRWAVQRTRTGRKRP